MPNRKKRLKRGISSLNIEIDKHKIKKKNAEEEGNAELARYYDKEINRLKNNSEKKKKILEK